MTGREWGLHCDVTARLWRDPMEGAASAPLPESLTHLMVRLGRHRSELTFHP